MTTIGTSREGRGEGQVVGDVVEDDVADELRVRDQLRRDVVAEGQREGEDRAGDDGREASGRITRAEGRAKGVAPRSSEALISEFGIRSSPA